MIADDLSKKALMSKVKPVRHLNIIDHYREHRYDKREKLYYVSTDDETPVYALIEGKKCYLKEKDDGIECRIKMAGGDRVHTFRYYDSIDFFKEYVGGFLRGIK